MDQSALSRKVDPQEAAMKKAADELARFDPSYRKQYFILDSQKTIFYPWLSENNILSLILRKVRQKQNPEAFSFKPMTSDKIDQMEKERKAAEERQKAEKEEREAKIKRQEKLVKILLIGGFLFVILYNLAKTAQSLAKKEVSVVTTPEKPLAKCEKELLARNSCRKEVEELCSALGIKVSQS